MNTSLLIRATIVGVQPGESIDTAAIDAIDLAKTTGADVLLVLNAAVVLVNSDSNQDDIRDRFHTAQLALRLTDLIREAGI